MGNCDGRIGCHSCTESLKSFIEIAEQVEKLRSHGFYEMAFKEMKSAKELARAIVCSGEDEV